MVSWPPVCTLVLWLGASVSICHFLEKLRMLSYQLITWMLIASFSSWSWLSCRISVCCCCCPSQNVHDVLFYGLLSFRVFLDLIHCTSFRSDCPFRIDDTLVLLLDRCRHGGYALPQWQHSFFFSLICCLSFRLRRSWGFVLRGWFLVDVFCDQFCNHNDCCLFSAFPSLILFACAAAWSFRLISSSMPSSVQLFRSSTCQGDSD